VAIPLRVHSYTSLDYMLSTPEANSLLQFIFFCMSLICFVSHYEISLCVMHFFISLFTMIIEELIAVNCFFAYVVVVNRIYSADELFLPTITCLSISGWVLK